MRVHLAPTRTVPTHPKKATSADVDEVVEIVEDAAAVEVVDVAVIVTAVLA